MSEESYESVNEFAAMSREVAGMLKRMWPDIPLEVQNVCARAVLRIGDGDVCICCTPEELEQLKQVPKNCKNIVSTTPSDNSLFVLSGNRLYTRRNYCYEKSILENLDVMARHQMPQIPGLEQGTLSESQYNALRLMSSHQFTLLSGGPGTGKTYTIAQAVRGAIEANSELKVRLCAPTAKASRRLMESMGEEFCKAHGIEATTIHSLLKQNPDMVTFRHNRDNPLDVGWLIVDEVSMLGLPLLAKLLEALPVDCRLTLAGDKDQLASVERGCVFGDLCRKYQDVLAVLTESRRFPPEGDVARLSQAINEGKFDAALTQLEHSTDISYIRLSENQAFKNNQWHGFKDLILSQMKEFSESTTPQAAAEHLNDFRVLCALRKGAFGVEYANEYLHGIMPRTAPVPWMITRNDNETGIVNGSMAIEMPDDPNYIYLVVEDGGEMRRISKRLLPDRELAYAITVHKSQGSEYNNICLVLPPDGISPILTREILYTAITRTKKSVAIYGSDVALNACVQHRVQRVSGMFISNDEN